MNDVISRLKTKRKTQILPPHVIKKEQEIHTPWLFGANTYGAYNTGRRV